MFRVVWIDLRFQRGSEGTLVGMMETILMTAGPRHAPPLLLAVFARQRGK